MKRLCLIAAALAAMSCSTASAAWVYVPSPVILPAPVVPYYEPVPPVYPYPYVYAHPHRVPPPAVRASRIHRAVRHTVWHALH